MDLFNIAKLIERGVYDVMMWVLFYPITMFKMIFAPRRTLAYVREQSALDDEAAYSAAMPPALFLFISLSLGAVLIPEHAGDTDIFQGSLFGKAISASWLTKTAFTMSVFSLLPLTGALFLTLMTRGTLTRETLRLPFDQQCYIGAPSLLMAIVLIGAEPRIGLPATIALAICALAWVIWAEYIFFLDSSRRGAPVCAAMTVVTLATGAALVAAAFAIALGTS